MKLKALLILALTFCVVTLPGCGALDQVVSGFSSIVGLSDTATVIAKTAQIRTSYAVVAADMLEVKRGDRLDVIDQVEFEKVLWYRVRARDEAKTEGWIEAQNVITSEVLDKSRKLAEDFQDTSPQAAGSLRAASNLRLAPDMSTGNILFKLASGSTFEIMDWQFVPKQEEVSDVDDAAKGEQKQKKKTRNEEIEAAKEAGEPEKLDEKYDIWYRVRLDPSVSPAPAGWLFGRQVELQVPSDLTFYQHNNRKFVTWQRLDTDTARTVSTDKMSAPGNWVVLSRSNQVKAIDGVEPEFDGILILAFDKYEQTYYTVWRTNGDVWGRLPLRIEGQGDNKTFIVRLRNPSGSMDEKRFVVFRDKSRVKVTPPEDIAQYQQARK